MAARFEAELIKVGGKTSTMLGVVKCLCGKNYADQSGATIIELCLAADGAGMKHPAGVTHSVADRKNAKLHRMESSKETRTRMAELLGGSTLFDEALAACSDLATMSR